LHHAAARRYHHDGHAPGRRHGQEAAALPEGRRRDDAGHRRARAAAADLRRLEGWALGPSDATPLHPDGAAYMEKSAAWAAAQGLPAFWEMPPARARQVYREFITTSGRPMPAMARVDDIRIPIRAGDCLGRLMIPAGDRSKPLPVIVYY